MLSENKNERQKVNQIIQRNSLSLVGNIKEEFSIRTEPRCYFIESSHRSNIKMPKMGHYDRHYVNRVPSCDKVFITMEN